MTVVLRRASQADQQAIRALVRAAHINPLGLEWRRFIVAVEPSGEVIGCGQVKEHDGGVQELASIVVAPEWRHKGVATTIVRFWMGQSGPPLWLTCRSGLVGFYARLAFREVFPDREMPVYFRRLRRVARSLQLLAGSGEHLAVMVWQGPSAPG